jgi:hypothetical protein
MRVIKEKGNFNSNILRNTLVIKGVFEEKDRMSIQNTSVPTRGAAPLYNLLNKFSFPAF